MFVVARRFVVHDYLFYDYFADLICPEAQHVIIGAWILLIYCWHFVFCQGVGDVIYSVIVVAYWRYSFSCFLPRIRIGSMRPLRDLQRLGVLEAPLAFFVHWFVAFFVALALNIPPRKKRGMALE